MSYKLEEHFFWQYKSPYSKKSRLENHFRLVKERRESVSDKHSTDDGVQQDNFCQLSRSATFDKTDSRKEEEDHGNKSINSDDGDFDDDNKDIHDNEEEDEDNAKNHHDDNEDEEKTGDDSDESYCR